MKILDRAPGVVRDALEISAGMRRLRRILAEHLTRERKIILGVGALLLVLSAAYRLVPAVTGAIPAEEVLEVKARQLAKYRQRAGLAGQVAPRLEEARQHLKKAESRLLEAKTPALAAVDIQQMMTHLAEKAGAGITTMRVLPAQRAAQEAYLAVPVEVTLAAETRQLVDLLYAMEQSPKLFRIREVTIRAAGARQTTRLLAVIAIEGLMRKPEPPGVGS